MRVTHKQPIFEGKKFKVEIHQIENDDGRVSKKELVLHPGAAVILGKLDDGRILLSKVVRQGINKTLIELPAGTLEKDEAPIDCAGRELQEETGYLAEKLVPIARFYSSPGFCNEIIYAFEATRLTKGRQRLDEGEEIEVMPVSMDEALALIESGQIVDGKTIATLLMYSRFGARGRNALPHGE